MLFKQLEQIQCKPKEFYEWFKRTTNLKRKNCDDACREEVVVSSIHCCLINAITTKQ